MSLSEFQKHHISVETKAPFITGTVVQGKLEGSYLSPGVASNFEDVQALHSQILPYLPEGERVPYNEDTFILLHQDGVMKVYAMSWLKLDTIKIVASNKLQVVVSGDMDQSRLRQLLLANGYNVVSMGTVVTGS